MGSDLVSVKVFGVERVICIVSVFQARYSSRDLPGNTHVNPWIIGEIPKKEFW